MLVNPRSWAVLATLMFLSGCNQVSSKSTIKIFLEDSPSYVQELTFINDFNTRYSLQEIHKHLVKQEWIQDFVIKRPSLNEVRIYIKSKVPQYVWNKQFYLDSALTKFQYDGGHQHLIHLAIPEAKIIQWNQNALRLQNILALHNLQIEEVFFNESDGWYLVTKSGLRANIGLILSKKSIHKFALGLKYIFENNLRPSIIDLRYPEGAALNYGK